MRAVILLLFSVQVFACPKGAPAGFETSPDKTERAYSSKDKTVTVVVKCEDKSKTDDYLKALPVLGEVHAVDKSISYVDVKAGVMRIYVGRGDDVTQVAVVTKTPADLEKIAPALQDYIKSH